MGEPSRRKIILLKLHCAGSICKIVPNIQNVRQILESRSQKALLIYEVFRGQTTDKFLDALKENNVIATKVLPNTTEICEGFHQKFNEWF